MFPGYVLWHPYEAEASLRQKDEQPHFLNKSGLDWDSERGKLKKPLKQTVHFTTYTLIKNSHRQAVQHFSIPWMLLTNNWAEDNLTPIIPGVVEKPQKC